MPQSPQVADIGPDEPFLTGYDMDHLVTYLPLLDADAEGAGRSRLRLNQWTWSRPAGYQAPDGSDRVPVKST
jgi:hypothetical protein